VRFFFCFLVFAAFTTVGYVIWRGYRKRKIFFENLIAFCNHLLVEISFAKNTVHHVIETYAAGYSPPFREVLTGYVKLIEAKADITRESVAAVMWTRLKPPERSAVTDFFFELGRAGVTEETQKIENAKIRFDTFFAGADGALKRDASIYLKIFIILGIAAAVLLL